MATVVITRVNDPRRKIQAIKALRDATRGPEGSGIAAMGLKEAKDLVDGVIAYARESPQFTAYDVEALKGHFEFKVVSSDDSVNRDDVLQFVFDVLSCADPVLARSLMVLPSYLRLKESL